MDISGEELRKEREAEKLTQQQIADEMGVSRQSINAWEQRAIVRPARAEEYLRVVRELASRRAKDEETPQ